MRITVDAGDYYWISRACRDAWRARLLAFPGRDADGCLDLTPAEWKVVLEMTAGDARLREWRGKLAEVLT